jgi:plastocyanin
MIMFKFNPKLLKLIVPSSVSLLLAAGCTQQPASPGMTPDVTQIPGSASNQPVMKDVAIDNFTFTPSTITIPVGTTVTWVNHDDVPHTVTSNDKVLASKAMDTDEKFSHLFAAPGTYAYFCGVHKHMTGEVIVK